MEPDIFFEQFNRLGVVIGFVELFSLFEHIGLIVSCDTHLSLMQTRLDRRVVVLGKRRARLAVKVPWGILFEELVRLYLLRRFI